MSSLAEPAINACDDLIPIMRDNRDMVKEIREKLDRLVENLS